MPPTERVASRLVTWLLEGREKVVVRPRSWLVKELPRGWMVRELPRGWLVKELPRGWHVSELAPLPKQRSIILLNLNPPFCISFSVPNTFH